MNKLFVFLWIVIISIGVFTNQLIPVQYKYVFGFIVGVIAQEFRSIAFKR